MGTDGQRRFVIWQGYQLHSDIGERLGLKSKLAKNEWTGLMSIHHPNAPQKGSKGRTILYRCPGDLCPASYQMPPDWDVWGAAPRPPTGLQETKTKLTPGHCIPVRRSWNAA